MNLKKLINEFRLVKVFLGLHMPRVFNGESVYMIDRFSWKYEKNHKKDEFYNYSIKVCWFCGGLTRGNCNIPSPILHKASCEYGELEERYNIIKWIVENKPKIGKHDATCEICQMSVVRDEKWDYGNGYQEFFDKIDHHPECKWKIEVKNAWRSSCGFKADK